MRVDYNNMLSERIGNEGISVADIKAMYPAINKAAKAMEVKRDQMAWRELPYNQAQVVKEIKEYAARTRAQVDAFVVLGIGGSALGPLAVQQALNHPHYNELPRAQRGDMPKLYVVDNIDPERLHCLFEIIDPTRCLFNVISKSGSTSETMSQFMIIQTMLEEKIGKENARKNIVCTTNPKSGNLLAIAKKEGYKTFYIPPGVGGRFSELSPVGLLPAAFCGIDIEGLLEGAAQMDSLCKNEDINQNPAYMYALLHYLAMSQDKNISVLMPYADGLKLIADWYAQLWAESLGKKHDLNGKIVNVGQTPVSALGATDQHSQVQLYTEGPYDKIIVIIGVEEYRASITIPKTYCEMPSLGFLGGHTHNELIHAMQTATEYALAKSGRMNMTITLPKITPQTIGQLLYFFEVATAFAGELLNIDAFDQPGVEEGKDVVYAMFGRPGYDDKKKELNSVPAKDEKFII